MYSFKDDYSELAHENILNEILINSRKQLDGYGMDSVSAEAGELIKKLFKLENADIYFLSGGTITNIVLISRSLSPIQGVISPDTGHICISECGAIEHNGGKIITVPNKDGKLFPCGIEKVLSKHINEHTVKPKLVFISQATERGTVYSKQELENLYKTCRQNNLYLYIDGARLGPALTSEGADVKPQDLARLCDAFYIGATKNGSPLGEALCIINENLKQDFRYFMKQRGAMPAKGALIGSCFKALFKDGLFFDLAKHANSTAQNLAKAITAKGYKMSCDSPTNQIFPILPNKKIAEIQQFFNFHVWEKLDDERSVIRLVCSWATDKTEAERFAAML